MQVINDLAKASLKHETILTIGAFDGVHRGHQALIGAVVEQAKATARLSALITFHPHPLAIRAPERAPRSLTTPHEKLSLLEELGVDLVALLPFDGTLADTTARTFMRMVARYLCPRELWIGADFRLGRNREGDVPSLRELGQELGYKVIVFQTVSGGEQAISSSRIRSLLGEGRVEKAASLLGRYPSVKGEVLPGSPTADLQVDPTRALPADGVYAAFAVLGGKRVPALARVSGSSGPKDAHQKVAVELLGSRSELNGCELAVEFVSRLGDERRSEHADDPLAPPESDRQAARRILSQARETASPQDSRLEAHLYHFREQEHTADRALQVWGKGLEGLFMGAAHGMCSLMGDPSNLPPQVWRTIRLEADDREALLVAWLNELLFLVEQEGLLFTSFCMDSLSDASGTAGATLVARVGGAVAPVTGAHIKAATYHDLKLVKTGGGWSVVITFDV